MVNFPSGPKVAKIWVLQTFCTRFARDIAFFLQKKYYFRENHSKAIATVLQGIKQI